MPGAIGFALSGWGRPDLTPLSLGYVNLPATGVRLALAAFLLATAARIGWDLMS